MTTVFYKWDGKAIAPRGTWWRDADGRFFASCQNGHINSLADHEVAEGGIVTPSVQCPHVDCGFHDHVVLEGCP